MEKTLKKINNLNFIIFSSFFIFTFVCFVLSDIKLKFQSVMYTFFFFKMVFFNSGKLNLALFIILCFIFVILVIVEVIYIRENKKIFYLPFYIINLPIGLIVTNSYDIIIEDINFIYVFMIITLIFSVIGFIYSIIYYELKEKKW